MNKGDFREIIQQIMEEGGVDPQKLARRTGPEPLPEAVIMTLKEIAAAAMAPSPWKPGDLVSVRTGMGIRGEGKPHIVIATLDTPHINFLPGGDDDGTYSYASSYGRMLNVRVVACIEGSHYAPYWMEHWTLIDYNPGE